MTKTKIFFKTSLFFGILLYWLFSAEKVYAQYCSCDDLGGGSTRKCVVCGPPTWICFVGPGQGGCPGGCFTGETKIATESGEKEIQNIKEGDVVKSFNAQTGEIKDASVSGIHKTTAPGYYILKTESGKEIKVTGEHPFLAIKQEKLEESPKDSLFKTLFSSLAGLVERIF